MGFKIVNKPKLVIAETPKPAEASSSADRVSEGQNNKADKVEVQVLASAYKANSSGIRKSSPFDAVVGIPEWMADEITDTFKDMKPPRQDLYDVLCQSDPELAADVSRDEFHAAQALMESMKKA